jgi:biotin carboxylase
MLLRDLEDLRGAFAQVAGSFVGVGMTAFSRVTPSYFIPSYSILCQRKTRDLPILRRRTQIFCLEEVLGEPTVEGLESLSLLSHPVSMEMLEGFVRPTHLVLYQNYAAIEELAAQRGWKPLANASALRLRLADRSFFKETLERLGIPSVPGAVLSLEDFLKGSYEGLSRRFGGTYVVQLMDIIQGGGRGTFFVRGPEQHEGLCRLLERGCWRAVTINRVLVRGFVNGQAASVALCITGKGTLVSRIQRQVIDAPYCEGFLESGIFCGHCWDDTPWPKKVALEAARQAEAIGRHLGSLGYRGICGMDLVVDLERELVYPLELNPRYTGAFPMLSLLHMGKGLIPMEAIHLSELLSLPVEFDVQALNEAYTAPLQGGHLLVFLLGAAGSPFVPRPLYPGLYELAQDGKSARFLGDCPLFGGPRDPWHFVVTEGPPDTGNKEVCFQDNLSRLCRLVFSVPITDWSGRIIPQADAAARWAYRQIIG